jgi:iron complex outermembrane receptor protein
MKNLIKLTGGLAIAAGLTLLTTPFDVTYAQEGAEDLEEVVVTGSRIRRDPLYEPTPITEIGKAELEQTGLTNLGDMLQNLPITGSAPNSQFNVPGNSGFPQDGAGIGAGAVQLSLRNLEAKRTLILVDGKRWVAGASASGVPSTVDLNTIPDNMIERVEILQDGASAIYGSDAIGGVVNIITDQSFDGFKFDVQTGGYLSDNDGESTEVGAKWGTGNGTSHIVFSLSYRDEKGIETANRSRSAFPNPDATSCNIPGTFCSSFTPQARIIFGPNLAGGADITLNDGVLNDGGANIPVFDPNNPASGDFHAFSGADRFNYNASGFNFLRTPNERTNAYVSAQTELSPSINLFGRFSYTKRTSETKAAPEPLCLGNGCGNRINDNFFVSALNPFNPFGVDLSVADGTMEFFGRRPLESGGRLFFQDVNTYFTTVGLEGEFEAAGRKMFWEVYGSYGDNSGFQEKQNSHNSAKLQVAMGDPAVCAATPNCVPFNFFGGQGPNGTGSITQEMLDFVTYTQRDFSEQTLKNYAFNLTGDLFEMPAGMAGFAFGLEYRDHEGSFRPDPIAERGETAGIPSGSTAGGFDVTEFYGEVNVPILSNGRQYWEANLAARSSDYSTFGSETTYKLSSLFQPTPEISLRGSVSTGFRAPGIGELFGGAAREDFTFLDPCADVLALSGSAAGGRDTPQPQNIIDNCAALGVPVAFIQNNPSLSSVSAGNSALDAETSDSITFGAVWSREFDASWISGITASIDFYDVEIDNAIQGRDPSDVLTQCVNTLDPLFCDLTPRATSGALDVIDNQLQNIGGIEASGYDVQVAYVSPDFNIGQFNVTFNASFLEDYTERTANVGGGETITDRTGSHTNETFQRAFPELRWTTAVGWSRDRLAGNLLFRWTDEMDLSGDTTVDSAMFTDLRLSYRPPVFDESLTVSLGFNNVFDEDPPVCFPCGVIGMSTVSHDLPGRVGYLRVSYQPQ